MLTQTHVYPAHIYPSLLHIAHLHRGFCLDAYGVFWGSNSSGLFPGSQETMKALVNSGKIVGILSNSSQLAEKEIAKLNRHGIRKGEHFHFLITSGEVARQKIVSQELPFPTPRKRFFLSCNNPQYIPHRAIFQNTPYTETDDIREADFIHIGIPHLNGEDQTDPSLFKSEVLRLRVSGLPMVCTNPDRFAHEGNPPKAVVRQGSIAAMYQELGGEVFYIGKPYENVYQAAMEQFRHFQIPECKDVLMVGDTPETDIRGAHGIGMASALVTKTGIMADRIQEKGFDMVIQGFPSTDLPKFYIEQLAAHGI